MPEQMTLDTILDDKPPVEAQEAEGVKVEINNANIRHQEKEEAAQGRVRNENGQFVKKEVKDEVKTEVKPEVKEPEKKEAPKQDFSDKERALLAALQDERRKRQELERQSKEG